MATSLAREQEKLVDQALANDEQAYYYDGSMALGHGFTVGDVYENMAIRTKLANGDAVKIHTREMNMRYGRLVEKADARRARARRYRDSRGRHRGRDRVTMANRKVNGLGAAGNVSDLLAAAAAAAFPKAKAGTFYALDVPSGGDKLDKLPTPDPLRYGATATTHATACGTKSVSVSRRRKAAEYLCGHSPVRLLEHPNEHPLEHL